MLAIVDNGNGAAELSQLIRAENKIIKPPQLGSVKASAYILSDGDVRLQKQNGKLIEKTHKPLLGIGTGCLFVAAAFGAPLKKVAKTERQERITIMKPCPLTLDMKKTLAVFESYQHVLAELPEGFVAAARSPRYEFEIIQHMERPFFGVQFLPEKGGDGRTMLMNFERFVEVWEKYHK